MRTGYSCALVQLTDFAPAGDLCGGACLPTWVTVSGPTCKGGDSGSPVFSGTTALGVLKGASYRGDGTCVFYFYMSVDYLPQGWQLLQVPPPVAIPGLDAPGRVHPSYDSLAPVDFEPTMQSRYIKESDLSHDVWETYSWGEFLRSREETFLAMTISSSRLNHPAFIRGNRLPQTDQAIIISS
ncbi:S1 family peptidase [Salmonella enterica]|uniref:S1 family peptidase n=1 Tax=Salmonella enterica TaxID=28901 RepID=UPI0021575F63|nr:S1 family peptidase [Salmonella enterica]